MNRSEKEAPRRHGRRIVSVIGTALAAAWLTMPVPAQAVTAAAPADPVVAVRGQANDEAGGMLFDERLAIVADHVPEFGSLHIDEEARTLFVHVTERRPRIVADLRHALRAAFPREELPARIQLLDGRFSFEQLHRWHGQALELFGTMDEVMMLDIDDRTNQMTIGLNDTGAEQELAEHLAGMGIPPEGWRMQHMDGVAPESSVADRHRPVTGGQQIQIGSATGGFCTYGLTATRNGVNGFITNSHCTRTQGGVESTRYAQPTFATDDANTIATEAADPSYFTGGICPANTRCRYSDSAFAQRTSTGSRSVVRNDIGSLAWDGSSRFYVANERSPFVGLALRKVGRTTGHTVGQVEATCADFRQTNTNILMLCQADATYASAGGDSGSPIFRTTGCTVGGQSDVCADVYGLHWGGGGAFSPIANIQRSSELGPLDTCATLDC
jgi:hypothetical protein